MSERTTKMDYDARESRRCEMERLQALIRQQPDQHWSEARHRIGVLATQLAELDRLEDA